MKTIMLILVGLMISTCAFSQTTDPMGLSEYVMRAPGPNGYQDRRLTNHEVDIFRATGFINPDGSVKQQSDQLQSAGTTTQGDLSAIRRDPLPSMQPPKGDKTDKVKGGAGTKYVPPDNYTISKKPLPTSQEIARQTKTKHKDHPQSKGTIEVRPTNFPDNPTHEDIVRMQQHIQHIERQVGRALDLSLSAYAVAELPQATEGRSGVSVGVASEGGKTAEAIGYSSNFGDKHEYTVKISLSHAGHEDTVGAGFGWQW